VARFGQVGDFREIEPLDATAFRQFSARLATVPVDIQTPRR
jgi:hypothetical protein